MAIVTSTHISILLPLIMLPALANGAPGDFSDATQQEVAALFDEAMVDGTFVVSSLDGSTNFVHNEERADTRFSPASTFKILNTLIGLKTGVVGSRDSTFTWDGTERGVAAWNRDQTLQSAFRVSCVWCYQEIARSVGKAIYLDELTTIGFGNQTIGGHVDRFWLDGSLRISASEQVDFLRKLCLDQLPFSRQNVDELRDIMLDEQSGGYALYGKTGWTGAALHTGWYVGFVEVADATWVFALNLEMDAAEQAPLRKQLALRSLEALGIIGN